MSSEIKEVSKEGFLQEFLILQEQSTESEAKEGEGPPRFTSAL